MQPTATSVLLVVMVGLMLVRVGADGDDRRAALLRCCLLRVRSDRDEAQYRQARCGCR